MIVKGSFLSQQEILALHEATLKILSETGVRFLNQTALDLFKKRGAKVDGQTVYIDSKLLKEALSSVPRSFKMYGRENGDTVEIGGGKPAYSPASGPIFVKRGGEKRLASTEDYINFLKLSQSSKVINVTNYIVVEPQDMQEDKRKLYQVASALKYSTKPLVGITLGDGKTRQCFELMRNFYGGLDENRLLGIISPISPLLYDDHMIENVIEYAQAGQPLLFASCSQPGATSPATVAGTLVIDSAQQLAGIVLSQILKPGLPIIYGSTSTSCDMRYASPAIGSPETALITLAISELSKFYGLPCRSGGTLTDSKVPDMQAGLESMMTVMSTMISGVDFVLHACGIMDSFNTLSYEKFIIDEETVSMAERFISGFEVNDEKLGLDTINTVGPGGMYLGEEHTAAHYRKELYTPYLFSRESYLDWEKSGMQSLEQRSSAEIDKRLQNYEQPTLTHEQERLLEKYLI
jgi:trimethylamine--corrinoid protein Co-methyltransferase